jgi:hypothetical protein
MNAHILAQIDECIVTEQQEVGFRVYVNAVADGYITPSYEDFQYFYDRWCAEEGLFNDIREANFPAADRPEWA